MENLGLALLGLIAWALSEIWDVLVSAAHHWFEIFVFLALVRMISSASKTEHGISVLDHRIVEMHGLLLRLDTELMTLRSDLRDLRLR